MKDPDKLDLQFIESTEGNKIPSVSFKIAIEISDPLLMFHICHLYWLAKQYGEARLKELKKYIHLQDVIESLYQCIKLKLKNEPDNIDIHFKEIKSNDYDFDECLRLFQIVKDELNLALSEENINL